MVVFNRTRLWFALNFELVGIGYKKEERLPVVPEV